MKVYVLISMLVVATKATDFTCATTELAVCCRLQTDDFSKCTAAELESNDFYGDGTDAPDYYCSRRRFARCCDNGTDVNNVYKTIAIGPQTGILSYAFTLTAKEGASTAVPSVTYKCKDGTTDDSRG
ncbi:hypothetical protein L207DRAFT_575617 [Hyaloscypha variabilis F]|uniref:Hydrophobin n=1 Tax=Hyaloscypha variabilis (strain UAMH 11265 / GT02V1 / F) TaxID=1149755 RepID=A0A2J6SDY4_HYAVF|nr:hypothetical protein L207DRAFT_575617 [Hyaloscypha variabilis F]